MKSRKITLKELTPKGNDQGWLVAIEAFKDFPFKISRIYYIFGTKAGVVRGKHAHKKLNQMVICLAGSCRFIIDDGYSRSSVALDSNIRAMSIPPMVWREMDNFSPDCVLLVLADAPYDTADYIRDYGDFLAAIRAKNISP